MNELRLLFDKTADQFTFRLTPSQGNASAPLPFTPFLHEEDFEDLRWYLEDYMDLPAGGSVVRAQRIEHGLEAWGRQRYDGIFAPESTGRLLGQLLQGAPPRLLTIATKDTDLLRLPWELLADARGPLTRQGVTIRRQLETAKQPITYQVGLPLRILLIVSRPDDLGFIDPRLTTRAMLDALKPLGDDAVVDFCRPPTLARMEQMLSAAQRQGQPYHIVHFDGHGTFLPEIELGALCFEKDQPNAAATKTETDYVRADRLGALLAAYNIPLVILEACRSGQIGRTAAFRSVALRLIDAGVGGVLSMSHAVHVEAARVLLERLYHELVANVTIGQALEAGRGALIVQPDRWIEPGPHGRKVALQDWFLPHLYQRSEEDLRLVPAGEERFDVFLSHQNASSERVEAIATQLRDRHGLRVWLDRWQLKRGYVQLQCEQGVQNSRIIVIVCTRKALASAWVEEERQMAYAKGLGSHNIIPILLEDVELPPGLKSLRQYDFKDPKNDMANIAQLAAAIAEGVPARPVRREPANGDEPGAFPRPPIHQFHGRALELYKLEQLLRTHRAILMHAMGGMGKTSLAREATLWWTRTGLFPDGACFLSFEQGASADRIVQTLGAYLEGHAFEPLSAEQQRQRAQKLFQQRRVLMVWDNFESVSPAFQGGDGPALYAEEERSRISELFRDWTEAPEGYGRLLVTCRPSEAGLPGACKVELHGLARPDSLYLLARVLQTSGVELNDKRLSKDALGRLLDTLTDHPLSIELVCPHLKEMTPDAIVADFHQLLAKFTGDAEVERNRSLLASLAFSTRRLSTQAQVALPWLGLFSGGVFEQILLRVSEIEPAVWELVRAELEATALVRVEREWLFADRPYLRFHPTLAYAAGSHVPDKDMARTRFIVVYLAVMRAVDKALHGSNPRGGMEVMAREEANFRTAVRWAVEDGSYGEASALGATFREYLERAGRLRERDSWVAWLAAEVRKGGFTEVAAAGERDEAWSLFTQGHAGEAIQKLEALIQRLRSTSDFDPTFQLATTQIILGRVYYAAGQAGRAIPILEDNAKQWERMIKNAEAKGEKAEVQRGNLSTTLHDLANALRRAGHLDKALAAAERGAEIDRELGREHEVAAALSRIAQILTDQGRYPEADAHYSEALQAVRRAGDKAMEGTVLLNQGSLAGNMGQYDSAAELYKQALKLFQDMGDQEGIMLIYNLLGLVEQKLGRLAEARAWYERSREIAKKRGDKDQLGEAAQNIGIVCQQEGEAARERGDETGARLRFEQAAASVQQSLRTSEELNNQPFAAESHGQLAQIYLLLGELDKAEEHAHRAREIEEGLGLLRELWKRYHTLAEIARARDREAEAVEWEHKRDEVRAELKRRAQGGNGMPPQFLQAIQSLASDCAQAGVDQTALAPQTEAALAQVEQLPAPFNALAPFCRGLAAGELPAVPAALPELLRALLEQIVDAVKQS
jgi:tetratricopeptide (TPR) repeat protein